MAILTEYDFTTDLSPSSSDAGVQTSAIVNGSLTNLSRLSLAYASSPVILCDVAPGATTAANAIANNSYFYFSVTPLSGQSISLTNLTFNAARGDADPNEGIDIRSSVDGYAATLQAGDIPTQRTTWTAYDIDLTGAAYQNLTNTVTFRFYVYAPTFEYTVDFDDIVLNGTVNSAGTVEQEGFRFRADNGSETGATWLASQDVGIIRQKQTPTRLRFVINSTLDRGEEQYQLEYRNLSDPNPEWRVIE